MNELAAYWQQRAIRLGPHAVLHIKHPPEALDDVTATHFGRVFDLVDPLRRGDERFALDFGCGAGRFTPLLARHLESQVLGVDPTDALIAQAPPAQGVRYEVLQDGRVALKDDAVDLLFVFSVLGGIPDAKLSQTLRELGRVLSPTGILVLIENTTDVPDAPHWFFRSVAQHVAMFPGLDLTHLGGYEEFGETMSIMAGRPCGLERAEEGSA